MFTSSEKRQIRSYLGYSGGFRDSNYVLESMMNVVGDQVEESAYARVLLASLAEIDLALGTLSTNTSTAGTIKKVDEIEFYPVTSESAAFTNLSNIEYGEILIERLRALFGVTLVGKYFRSAPGSFYDYSCQVP